MKITIQLFGHFRKFGDFVLLELPPGSRIADLEREFMRTIENRDSSFYLNSGLRASRFCDNSAILPSTHPLTEGGCFSILPPVSGG
jgi:molybdopterin converting factor small subunit